MSWAQAEEEEKKKKKKTRTSSWTIELDKKTSRV